MSDWADPATLPELPADFRRFAKKLNEVDDLAESIADALKTGVRSRAIAFGGASLPQPETKSGKQSRVTAVLEAGVRAVEKCAENPAAVLGPEEEAGFESIVRLRERPALLVRNDNFPAPPERWRRLQTDFRSDICGRLPCSGRIDRRPGEMVGTGFVVAEDLVMTNKHVICLFADRSPEETGPWEIHSSAQPSIDFKVEYGETAVRRFPVVEIVAVHPKLDIALLRIAGATPPQPIKLAGSAPDTSNTLEIYAVGYPWTDNDPENKTPPEVIEAIYGDIFQVKRLQPGEFNSMFAAYGAFSHDCSTLGGNSGSCIVDLKNNKVIGIHFKGSYRQANYAIALWMLKDDPMFTGKGLNY
jgi:glutamyl endopeptidase